MSNESTFNDGEYGQSFAHEVLAEASDVIECAMRDIDREREERKAAQTIRDLPLSQQVPNMSGSRIHRLLGHIQGRVSRFFDYFRRS